MATCLEPPDISRWTTLHGRLIYMRAEPLVTPLVSVVLQRHCNGKRQKSQQSHEISPALMPGSATCSA